MSQTEKQYAEIRRNIYEAVSASNQLFFELEQAGLYDQMELLRRQTKCCFKILAAIANPEELEKYEKKLNISTVNISQLTEDIVNACRSKLRMLPVEFVYDCDEGIYISTDPERYVACMANLIVNAVNNIPMDGGVVTVKVKKYGNSCAISVSDNGYSLSYTEYQTAEALALENKTGLAVVSKYCESLGSKIIVEVGDCGATISFKAEIATPNFESAPTYTLNTGLFAPINVYLAKIEGCTVDML